MAKRKITTIGESLHWSYANLAMAHAAVKDGAESYGPTHFMIRSRLFAGLQNGTMNVRPFADDERLKMILPQACCYCGSRDTLSLDHVIPKKKGGTEDADNLIWSCKSCNSSKGATDLLEWMKRKDRFPPLLLLRRYLKLVIQFCRDDNLMDTVLEDVSSLTSPLPFSTSMIPHRFPKLADLSLWIIPVPDR